MRQHAKAALLAPLLVACGLSTAPAAPRDQDPREISLGVGDEMPIPDTALRVALLGVEEDSRCPIDVVCVWEGNAAVQLGLTAGSGPTHLLVLNTALEPKAVDFGGVRLTLVSVAPAPRQGVQIPPEDYVVTLRFEPVEL